MKMNTTNNNSHNHTTEEILGELERLAAACPWDTVDVWITRYPEGKYRYTAYIKENQQLGSHSVFGNGDTAEEAVTKAIREAGDRSPEHARAKKIAELEDRITKLRSVEIGLPPYIPNRELAVRNQPAIVDV